MYGLVWAWLSFDIGDDVKKLWGGVLVVVGCTLDYSSGPFLSYEIEIGDGPGPEIDNLGQILVVVVGMLVWKLLVRMVVGWNG